MFNFILGVVVTLAIMYPTTAKHVVATAIDTAHVVVTDYDKEHSKEAEKKADPQ
jgi:hypothetical protein